MVNSINKITSALVIQPKKAGKLTPAQERFNYFVQQIEALQIKMSRTGAKLDKFMDFYRGNIVPLESKNLSLRITLIKALFPYCKRKRRELTKDEHHRLRRIVTDQLNIVLKIEQDPDEEIKAIYTKLTGNSYDEQAAEDMEMAFEMAKAFAEQRFDDEGIHFNEQEFAAIKTFEALQAFLLRHLNDNDKNFDQEQQQAGDSFEFQKGSTSKSAKDLQNELLEKKAASDQQKNISIVYKQLAKLFHPDLETDESKKAEKVSLMQELTAAYRNRDMHTLLRLELKWIQKADNQLLELAEERLEVYNDILQEQVRDLKKQIDALKFHPQYGALDQFESYGVRVSMKVLKEKLGYEQSIGQSMQESISALKSNDLHSIIEIKSIIATQSRMEEEFSLLDNMMEDMDDDEFWP
ncbi:MAG TPA: hypothetical protein VL053_00105 [Arachidicoccus sp.]|nr:hypothetical protein [Arachidicoccus sp.]